MAAALRDVVAAGGEDELGAWPEPMAGGQNAHHQFIRVFRPALNSFRAILSTGGALAGHTGQHAQLQSLLWSSFKTMNAIEKFAGLEDELKKLKKDPADAAAARELETSAEFTTLQSFLSEWDAFKTKHLAASAKQYDVLCAYQAAPPTGKKAAAAAATNPRPPACGLKVMRALEARAAQGKKEAEAEKARAAAAKPAEDAGHVLYLKSVVANYERRLGDAGRKTAAARATSRVVAAEVEAAKTAKARSADRLKTISSANDIYAGCLELQELNDSVVAKQEAYQDARTKEMEAADEETDLADRLKAVKAALAAVDGSGPPSAKKAKK